MTIEKTILKGQTHLRRGFTTGTCAAAAAKAAAAMLFTGTCEPSVNVLLPGGSSVTLPVKLVSAANVTTDAATDSAGNTADYAAGGAVTCAVIKDAGDDPDITDGMVIHALVAIAASHAGIHLDGGTGVGRVTKPGLDQPVGMAAINRVPRQMIMQAVAETAEQYGYEGGLDVVISIPGGEEAARKTLNPTLGIVGGLSILGTSGIVEPMSEQALIDTIQVEIRQHKAMGEDLLILAPGNYGLDFLRETYGVETKRAVKISNYAGISIDLAISEGFESVLLVGHIGKLVKIAGGIMNTHSKEADSRMEILTANALQAGADIGVLRELMQAVTTDAALDILKRENLLGLTMRRIINQITYYLDRRAGGRLKIGVMMFSNVYGLLGMNEQAEEMLLKGR